LHPSPEGTNIVYGVSAEFTMSRMDESDQPELQIFVEDKRSEVMVREIVLSTSADENLRRVSFIEVGPANVVKLLGSLAQKNKLPYKAIGVVDGDYDESPGCIKLPGGKAPERVVFEDLKAKRWAELPERFGVGAGNLFTILEDAMLEPDHHEWPRMVGDKLRLSSNSIWEIMTKEWVNVCLEQSEKQRVSAAILDLLP
jgi:hypothetical protein